MESLLLPLYQSNQLVEIALWVLALIVVFVVLRFVLNLALRIASLGCGLILLAGVLYFLWRYLF
jgi:hypothetical protein